MRTTTSLPILLSAALLAGCGGSGGGNSAVPAPDAPAKSAPAPSSNGGLRVGATDGGVGPATVGDPGGLKILPSNKVPGSSSTQQGVGAGASCEDAEIVPSNENMPKVVASTLCLLNGERTDAGLKALSQNGRLAQAAAGHSQDMVAKQYFDHTAKDGSDPVTRIRNTGYIPSSGTWTVGENLAWGTGTLASPKKIVAAWMKSHGHRENILRGAFKEIGFGVVSGNPRSKNGSGATFTTTFGAVSAKSSKKKKRARAARKARAARAARRR